MFLDAISLVNPHDIFDLHEAYNDCNQHSYRYDFHKLIHYHSRHHDSHQLVHHHQHYYFDRSYSIRDTDSI